MRESLAPVDMLADAIRRDPAAVSPAEQARLAYLEVQRRPLLQAMFARNSELLGELAHEGAVEPLREWKGELAREQFQLLREHGLMRTDLDIDTQQYVLGAVQTGFYLHQPAPGSAGAAPEAVAAALSHTIHAAVQPPGTPIRTLLPPWSRRCSRATNGSGPRWRRRSSSGRPRQSDRPDTP